MFHLLYFLWKTARLSLALDVAERNARFSRNPWQRDKERKGNRRGSKGDVRRSADTGGTMMKSRGFRAIKRKEIEGDELI